jgi:hypothetical protein
MAIIPAGFAQTVFFNRANLVKKIQGQPAPQVNIVLQTIVIYSVQGLIQMLSKMGSDQGRTPLTEA